MQDIQITFDEVVEELKKQIGELSQTNAILNVKCRKLEEQLNECMCEHEK